MPWVKMDDRRATHRKFRRAGFAVRGLDEAAIEWSSQHGTDGLITPDDLGDLAHHHGVPLREARRLADTLVRIGRWDEKGDDWLIHDYLDYNPTAAAAAKRREIRAEAGRIGGLRSRRGSGHDEAHASADASAHAKADAEQPLQQNGSTNSSKIEAKFNPVPSRSYTSPPTTSSNAASGPGVVVVEAIRILAERERAAAGAVRNEAGWQRHVTERLRAEHLTRAKALVAADPSLDAGRLAELLVPSRPPTDPEKPSDRRPLTKRQQLETALRGAELSGDEIAVEAIGEELARLGPDA